MFPIWEHGSGRIEFGTMTSDQLIALKDDFLSWTGGFEPESSEQITAYAAYSMPYDLKENEAIKALLDWMQPVESA
jgi:hypothetical protein